MDFTLKIWRQKNAGSPGEVTTYAVTDVTPDTTFLEMLDLLNTQLTLKGEPAIAFDHDCREGICGQCGLYVNGRAHGPATGTTTCQLHMRAFQDGDTIYIEPWRAAPFPILQDLIVDRSAFDRIVQSGGYISVNTGAAPESNAIPIKKRDADKAFDAAACIGCGACVAACKNASAMLFVSAKIVHLNLLPQGQMEAEDRVQTMAAQMDAEGFGSCTYTGDCEAECPAHISIHHIAGMNGAFLRATVTNE